MIPARRVLKAHKATRVRKGTLARVCKVTLARRALKEPKVIQAQQVRKGRRVTRGRPDRKALKVTLVQRGLPVRKGIQA